MAVYQFVCGLIPQSWALKNTETEKKFFKEGLYDFSSAWINTDYSEIYDKNFSKILHKNKSWNDEVLLWGTEASNDIQLILNEKNTIESIRIRIDLRSAKKEFIAQIISVAKNLNCYLFLYEFNKVILADLDELFKYICKSTAYRFVNDHDGFWQSIK